MSENKARKTRAADTDTGIEYGPLGPGHDPEKDPLKGLRGVMAGTMFMEAISILLVLTVILRVQEGALWTPFNWGYVTAVGVTMVILSFLQGKKWIIPVNIGIQVPALLGFFIHPSMGFMALLFVLVWWYLLTLRKNLIERMKRGLLTTQHL